MSVYEPLTRFLMSRSDAVWEADFSEIEKVLGRRLPESAYDHRTWWGNRKAGNHGHANAWRDAGWQTKEVDVERRKVRFERMHPRQQHAVASTGAGSLADMWRTAGELSGISDREELEREVLKTFIRRTAARRLAELGGSMPDFVAAPRERPFG